MSPQKGLDSFNRRAEAGRRAADEGEGRAFSSVGLFAALWTARVGPVGPHKPIGVMAPRDATLGPKTLVARADRVED